MQPWRLNGKEIHGDFPFAEVGEPTGLFWSLDQTKFAVAGDFHQLWWIGRDGDNDSLAFERRLCIYDACDGSLIAVRNLGGYMINDVAFHPKLPLVAIGTGDYDGGYLFEGELLIWDYERDLCFSYLDESREVTRCAFDEYRDVLQFMLRPVCDMDDEDNDISDEYETVETPDFLRSVEEGSIAYPLEEKSPVFDQPYVDQDPVVIHRTLQDMATLQGATYEGRGVVRDVVWKSATEVVVLHATGVLELWSIDGGRKWQVQEPEVDGLQLFLSVDRKFVYVHGAFRHNTGKVSSQVRKYELEKGESVAEIDLGVPYVLSMTEEETFLLRFPVNRARGKEVVDSLMWLREGRFERGKALPLGEYGFGYYLRVDGAAHLYYLQGATEDPQSERWMYRLHPESERTESLFQFDGERESVHLYGEKERLFCDDGCSVADEYGESLVLAVRVFDGTNQTDARIVRRHVAGGETLWSQKFASLVTAVRWLPKQELVAFALAEGKVGLLSSVTGEIQWLQEVKVDGVTTMILALDFLEGRLVAGTVDGLIFCYELCHA